MFKNKVILASKSPRRSQLMEAAGFDIEVRTMPIEERYPTDMPVEDVPVFLARKKANESVSLLENDEEILLAADTVVIIGNTIYGKPKDFDDAVRILQELSGRPHHVITGVCLKSRSKEVAFSGLSTVHVGMLTNEEIEYYVKNYEPYDKAGAYAIQEWIGLCKIDKIEGTYANIMGLPMHLVYKELMNF